MPTIGGVRKYHGPYGPNNFISDNPLIALARDVNNRITSITLTTVEGVALIKTITRTPAGIITNVSRWSVV